VTSGVSADQIQGFCKERVALSSDTACGLDSVIFVKSLDKGALMIPSQFYFVCDESTRERIPSRIV
jgi:hypothetical protein